MIEKPWYFRAYDNPFRLVLFTWDDYFISFYYDRKPLSFSYGRSFYFVLLWSKSIVLFTWDDYSILFYYDRKASRSQNKKMNYDWYIYIFLIISTREQWFFMNQKNCSILFINKLYLFPKYRQISQQELNNWRWKKKPTDSWWE